MNENKARTQQRLLYLGSMSFSESKTVKDKVTTLTSALRARMSRWVGGPAAARSAFYWRMDMEAR